MSWVGTIELGAHSRLRRAVQTCLAMWWELVDKNNPNIQLSATIKGTLIKILKFQERLRMSGSCSFWESFQTWVFRIWIQAADDTSIQLQRALLVMPSTITIGLWLWRKYKCDSNWPVNKYLANITDWMQGSHQLWSDVSVLKWSAQGWISTEMSCVKHNFSPRQPRL